jgi:hypothetical protein|tara:strand:- start:293 stop:406 length:114 start_codon:yes stop_codon:yes gene_type:complete
MFEFLQLLVLIAIAAILFKGFTETVEVLQDIEDKIKE